MFKTHARKIRKYATATPDGMAHVIFFAVATANCPFGQSVTTMNTLRKWTKPHSDGTTDLDFMVYSEITVEQKSGMGCGLTGMKMAAYQYIWANRFDIHAKYMECQNTENGHLIFWNYCMDCLCGMGMVKAAFAVQMLFNELGCIDIHNAKELGYSKCPSGKAMKQRAIYLNIQSVKTSEEWWNDWCRMLAKKYPGQFKSGEQVSKMHSDCITGG